MAVDASAAPPPKRRLVLGAGVFVLGWVVSLAAASLISASTLPTSIVPIVLFVGPKFGVLASIAILGKPGFAYLKGLVFGKLKPPDEVSVARHRIGIVMFVAAILLAYLERYPSIFLPDSTTLNIRYSLAVDLLLLASIFVLGGDFWDKLRSLFFRDAKAYFS